MRAKLSDSFSKKRENLEQIFNFVQNQLSDNLYVSIAAQSVQSDEYSVNPKQQNFTDKTSEGFNVRVFDGICMHEWASPEISLEKVEGELGQWLAKTDFNDPGSPVYRSPSWTERTVAKLEREITEQIPGGANAETWVHFGAPIKQAWPKTNAEGMAIAESKFNELGAAALKLDDSHPARVLDFTVCRLRFSYEQHAFIDSSVRMTQALPRVLAMVVGVKNAERAVALSGGLGGMESVILGEEQYSEIFRDIKNVVTAESLPPGRYQLLMHPSISGVFAHEAFGHSQEGDTWSRGRSKAKDIYEAGEKVGNEHATIYNNPAIYKNAWEESVAWGSYYFDEEGWLAQEQVLVEKGRLKPPMTDFVSAYKLGVPRTANGKRENWKHGVYTRQTNTYFSEGDKTFKELLSSMEDGLYARHPYGGMEDPKGLGIQVGISYVEEVKDGKLTGKTFKGPSGGALQMTGYVPDYLNQIVAKSKIDAHAEGEDTSKVPWNEVGGCGKYHKESVVAGCGGPYLLVNNALLS